MNSKFRVVLYRPQESMNVGSVARAMSNFGFEKLHVVAARDYEERHARKTACWGVDLLERASIHASLEEVYSQVQEVVAFSSSSGTTRQETLTLSEWIARIESLGSIPETALLFGPEDSGLSKAELSQSAVIVQIPTVTSNPSLNLAQAVGITLYQISQAKSPHSSRLDSDQVEWSKFEHLDRTIDELGSCTEFWGGATSEAAPRLLKQLMRRARPSEREFSILVGLLSSALRKLQSGN